MSGVNNPPVLTAASLTAGLNLILTTRGDMLRRGATDAERLAVGANTEVVTSDGTDPDWAAAGGGGGAVTRLGGVATEATTTSTSTVDLLTITGLSIAAGTPVRTFCSVRKTAGAVDSARVGFKMNTTAVRVVSNFTNNTDEAQEGFYFIQLVTGDTSYDGTYNEHRGSSKGGQDFTDPNSVPLPTATITDLIVTAEVDDALITMGANHFQAYSWSVS